MQRQQRAEPGERQRREDRERVDEALVEDAEHHVDDEDREHEQQPEPLHRGLERLRRALEVGVIGRRQRLAREPVDLLGRLAERDARRAG